MSDIKIDELYNNGAFCVAPWVQIHLTPESEIRPCCFVSKPFDSKPKSGGLTNIEILNTPEMKELREMMLNGEKHEVCSLCYTHEAENRSVNSLRNYYNKTFNNPRTANLVEFNTEPDGTLMDLDVQYIDIRWSNLCNLRCRMCGLEYSSSWYDEYQEFEIPEHKKNKPKFINADYSGDIYELLDSVIEIYFAGGEPTINPNHYKMLNYLIEKGRTDVILKYNTNLTTIKYKSNDLIEMWNKFDTVQIGASIDGFGDTLEYIRTDVRWDRISSNIDRIMNETHDNVYLYMSPTIGVMNVEMMPAFHRLGYERGFFGKPKTYGDTFMTNFIETPHNQSIKNLPPHYKQHVTNVIEDHILWIEENIFTHQREELIGKWGYILSFMNNTTPDEDVVKWHMNGIRAEMDAWDRRNGSNWRTQLPHLQRIYE